MQLKQKDSILAILDKTGTSEASNNGQDVYINTTCNWNKFSLEHCGYGNVLCQQTFEIIGSLEWYSKYRQPYNTVNLGSLVHFVRSASLYSQRQLLGSIKVQVPTPFTLPLSLNLLLLSHRLLHSLDLKNVSPLMQPNQLKHRLNIILGKCSSRRPQSRLSRLSGPSHLDTLDVVLVLVLGVLVERLLAVGRRGDEGLNS